ncbi:hypothetical protein HN011_007788 [Eciton burchellii]|nr:hypothetical protein HN011_007788 [Eciton burchellii]
MKSYWIFLFGFVASVAVAENITATTLEACSPGSWVLTNTTVILLNDTKEITSNIIISECENCPLYTIHILINGCQNNSNCTGDPLVWVNQVQCDNGENITDLDLDACKVAQEIGKAEKIKDWFNRYGPLYGPWLYESKFCADLIYVDYSGSFELDVSDESDESDDESNSSNLSDLPDKSGKPHRPQKSKESKESKESKGPKGPKGPNGPKGPKGSKESKESKNPKGSKELNSRGARKPRRSRERH